MHTLQCFNANGEHVRHTPDRFTVNVTKFHVEKSRMSGDEKTMSFFSSRC